MLVRLEAASELAGRRGCGFGGEPSMGRGGWREARLLLFMLLFETRGGAEGWDARRGLVLENDRWAAGGPPEAPRRSRKERRGEFLEGVPPGIGEADASRERGLRRVGSLDAEEGVKAEAERTGVGIFLAYGLGVVRLRGLKLWPVSMSPVFVEPFHFGLWAKEEDGRDIRFPVGVAEPSLDGTESVDIRAATGFRVI